MGDMNFTVPALVSLLLPTVLFPLITMLFLRTQRGRADYGLTRWLFLLGALIWIALACWEAFDLKTNAFPINSPFRLRDLFHADTFRATLPRWIMLCLPAFPTFFAIVVMFRKRFQIS